MGQAVSDAMIRDIVKRYARTLQENGVPVMSLYLFGSHLKGTSDDQSDIDVAVFLNQEEVDGFEEDLRLMRLTRHVDLRIEPHTFSRLDFENPDPFVEEVITKGERLI